MRIARCWSMRSFGCTTECVMGRAERLRSVRPWKIGRTGRRGGSRALADPTERRPDRDSAPANRGGSVANAPDEGR